MFLNIKPQHLKIILALAAAGVIAYFVYKKYNPEGSPLKFMGAGASSEEAKEKAELIKKCKDDCDLWNKACLLPCDKLGKTLGGACKLACRATTAICNKTCTGKSGIRNASLHHIMILDKNKKPIAQLGPIDPRKQNLEISDFPIYATRCGENIDHPACPRSESHILKIERPGCYILWGGTPGISLYTTKGAC